MSQSGEGSVWYQREIAISAKKRGCHLITDDVLHQVPEIQKIKIGTANVHIKHTSASLCLNENWDPDVRVDMEMMMNKLIPESTPFKHSCEGPDDMPAHVKAAFIGTGVTIPISNGKFNLGTWQGLWLCEHRNSAGKRTLVVTVNGCPLR
ncbi:UPF0047 protein YjbQ-like isoform X1 [Crassostrea angulata]|uniref:Uncharacterized protein n=1 Tax=Magallana gigas TaxID=29159 RepID=A0A8W8MG35_MAGGI|nr:UPF0047 protein YjbQ isoform X2 [Crassostrea gigas]XP_052683413.1 UPF0047 protein YjbQ-like isoform X1 [Crassostrea angulata]